MRGLGLGLVALMMLMPAAAEAQSAGTLQAFSSDRELTTFLARRAAQQERRRRAMAPSTPLPPSVVEAPVPAPPVAMAPPAESATADMVVTGSIAQRQPSITNTQEADVDEGGIVKVHGDHLVVLRRGRLFTVAVGDRRMRPVSRIDAFPPGTTGRGAWYDEMLVSGDRVIVIGYSYDRGGTEINRFRIGADGRLSYQDSYHLRSNDYYSSTNYASRLIGNQLIFYTPLGLDLDEPIGTQLPGLRRWTGEKEKPFVRIAPATRVFLPRPLRLDAEADISTLHTVTTCDLATGEMRCTATGVLGSGSRNFYVSGNAVYVWLANAVRTGREGRAMVYRLPLDGTRPGAVQAWGGPVDQFSFREDRPGRALDVLVRADGGGERMWRSVVTMGEPALVHVPLEVFGDGSRQVAAAAYRPLPLPSRQSYSFHNRFVGRHLVYSAGGFAEETGKQIAFVVPVAGGPVARIETPHGIDRIDIIGADAVVIGNDARDQLGFSAIELGGTPRLGDTSFIAKAREGENRSQAFFFRPDADSPNGASGTIGLPVTRELADNPGRRFLGSGSAVTFIRRDARRLRPAGELVANDAAARDDGCQASCVDWYGNARPIFLGERVFALMGYELVEGRMRSGRIGEVARVDFAPPAGRSVED